MRHRMGSGAAGKVPFYRESNLLLASDPGNGLASEKRNPPPFSLSHSPFLSFAPSLSFSGSCSVPLF